MAKNNKKSKQKKSVLNKLGGLSKRSKFIVVVLIFAVLGGGYLTYKSFAYTTNPDGSVSNPSIVSYAGDIIDRNSSCTLNLAADPAKNNMTVMNIYCPPNRPFALEGKSGAATGVFYPYGYKFMCVYAKGVGHIYMSDEKYTNQRFKYYLINNSKYQEYCGPAIKLTPDNNVLGTRQLKIYSKHDNPNPTLLTVSSIYWKYGSSISVAPPSSK